METNQIGFNHSAACGNKYSVADEVIFSGYLLTRFTGSRSPIRNVVSFYDCFSVLRNFAYDDVVPMTSGRCLAICLTGLAFIPNRYQLC